jgi:hypothetical protein
LADVDQVSVSLLHRPSPLPPWCATTSIQTLLPPVQLRRPPTKPRFRRRNPLPSAEPGILPAPMPDLNPAITPNVHSGVCLSVPEPAPSAVPSTPYCSVSMGHAPAAEALARLDCAALALPCAFTPRPFATHCSYLDALLTPAPPSPSPTPHPPRKLSLHGCFRCLSPEHKVHGCRDLIHCRDCGCSGHHARACTMFWSRSASLPPLRITRSPPPRVASWPTTTPTPPFPISPTSPPHHSALRLPRMRLICLKRIYNFLCSMLIFTPFALCFVTLRGVFMRFPELNY